MGPLWLLCGLGTFLRHFTVDLSQLWFLPSELTPLPTDFLIHKDE